MGGAPAEVKLYGLSCRASSSMQESYVINDMGEAERHGRSPGRGQATWAGATPVPALL